MRKKGRSKSYTKLCCEEMRYRHLRRSRSKREIEGNASVLPAFLKAVSELRIRVSDINGQLLPYLIPHAQRKHELLEAAWEAWEPLRQHGIGFVKTGGGAATRQRGGAGLSAPGEKAKRGVSGIDSSSCISSNSK